MEVLKIRHLHVNLNPLNNFMIRYGYLKLLSVMLDDKDDYDYVKQKIKKNFFWTIPVDLTENKHITKYILNKKLYGKGKKRKFRYHDLTFDRTTNTFQAEDNNSIKKYPIYFLDICLSDPELNSRLGAIGEENIVEIVNWAVWTKVIQERWHNRALRGKIILELMNENERNILKNKKENVEYYWKNNPFKLKNEKYFLLKMLLEDDFLLIVKLIPKLEEMTTFNRMDAAIAYKNVLEEILAELNKLDSFNDYYEERKIIKNILTQINREKEDKSKRQLTAMQRVSSRLENLVDLGLLDNRTKFTYEYKVNARTKDFNNYLSKTENYNEFYNEHYWSMINDIYELNKKRYLDQTIVEQELIKTYDKLKPPFGDARIYPIAIEVLNNYITKTKYYIEYSDLIDFMFELEKKYSREFHLSGGKIKGDIEFISIKHDLVKKFRITK